MSLLGWCSAIGSTPTRAQSPGVDPLPDLIQYATATRIADPKLDGGGFSISVSLRPSILPYRVKIDVLDPAANVIADVFTGRLRSRVVNRHAWDGRDSGGQIVPPDHYAIRVQASQSGTIDVETLPIDVVRLGVISFAAQSSKTNAEWQMVYFLKNGAYAFYATPETAEYVCTADDGEIAELDLDDGTPRPAPAIHTKTDEAVLEPDGSGGYRYEDDSHNYPLCFLSGTQPEFVATFGSTCTDGSGVAHGVNYPVAGYELRMIGIDANGLVWTTDDTSIVPGGTQLLVGPELSDLQTRTDLSIDWQWQYRAAGDTAWTNTPGRATTAHRFYTQLSFPRWGEDTGATQYSGPWVEVSEYQHTWSEGLGIPGDSSEAVVETLIKGFFGQNGPFATAIENVRYDCPSEGGDGGATHYYNFSNNSLNLTRLLNSHANGPYVNCSDCASSTSTMLAMLGVKRMRMMRLGSMTLRAIWGIGTDDYTLDLWSNGGGSGHGFSYHHIITRDSGDHCSDACLCVDEDGNPNALPGTPGWNHDRDWNDYEALLGKANITWQLDPLPKLR